MTHFAYPNVLARKKLFIGCGRYAVFPPESKPESYYTEVKEAPATPNQSTLKRAVQLLIADSYRTENRLFHLQDRDDHTYQGDSLDLAWLLAKIHCTRMLRQPLVGDIWCTGVVEVGSGKVHLLDVNADGFSLKLEAFLSPENRDTLFLVPLANMEPHIITRCQESGVEIQPLGSIPPHKQLMPEGKRIITITADNVPLLLKTLFGSKSGKEIPLRKRTIAVASLSILLVSGILFTGGFIEKSSVEKEPYTSASSDSLHPLERGGIPAEQKEPEKKLPASPDDIRTALQYGDFAPVHEFMERIAQQKESSSPEELELYRQIQNPFEVEAKLKYRLAAGQTGEIPLTTDGKDFPVLTSNDYYRFEISPATTVDAARDTVWIYLVQVDSNNKLEILFPNHLRNLNNPVQRGQWPLHLPRSMDLWFILDQADSGGKKQKNTIIEVENEQWTEEKIYLLVTPWQACDIEDIYKVFKQKPDDTKTENHILERMKKRGESPLPSFFYISCSFWHSDKI